MVSADDTMSADSAYRLACEGTGLLWQGDFQNARQLLQALVRRLEPKAKKSKKPAPPVSPAQAFNLHRQALGQRARVLGQLLIPMDADYSIPLRRAPDLRQACTEAWGPTDGQACMVSLRELLGLRARMSGAKKGLKSQRWACHRSTAFIRITACSRPCAANTWIWWHKRPCPQPV